MAYHALYRSYRPQTFQAVVGQEHVTHTLQNAIRQGRVGHAYLFAGPRGTGKTTVARLLAKAVNCSGRAPDSGEPCNECDTCRSIGAGSALDVVEIDAASHRGIDEIRDLRDKVHYASGKCPFKVYIIDEVHMLTDPAFNALLKTLEDPPGQVIFILATTDPHKVPITITSRCQRFDFRRLTMSQIRDQLRFVCQLEGIVADDAALQLIARHAGGGMRDALSVLDQARALGDGKVVEVEHLYALLGTAGDEWLSAFTRAAGAGDLAAGLQLIEDAFARGHDMRQLLKDWLGHLRNLLVLKVGVSGDGILTVLPEQLDELKAQAESFSREQLLTLLEYLSERESVMRWVPDGRIVLETAFIRAVSLLAGSTGNKAEDAASKTMLTSQAVDYNLSAAGITAAAKARGNAGAGKTVKGSTGRRDEEGHATGRADRPVDLQAMKDAWPRIVDNVRRRSAKVYAFIEPARLHSFDGALLTLDFGGHDFHHKQMQSPNNQKVVVEAINAVLGVRVRLACVALANDDAAAVDAVAAAIPEPEVVGDSQSPKGSTSAAGQQSGLLGDAVELFGGEFVVTRGDLP